MGASVAGLLACRLLGAELGPSLLGCFGDALYASDRDL
jgi:hypothetical protein